MNTLLPYIGSKYPLDGGKFCGETFRDMFEKDAVIEVTTRRRQNIFTHYFNAEEYCNYLWNNLTRYSVEHFRVTDVEVIGLGRYQYELKTESMQTVNRDGEIELRIVEKEIIVVENGKITRIEAAREEIE